MKRPRSIWSRLGFLLAGLIYVIEGWQRDGPLLPLLTVAAAGVLIGFLLLKQRRREARERPFRE